MRIIISQSMGGKTTPGPKFPNQYRFEELPDGIALGMIAGEPNQWHRLRPTEEFEDWRTTMNIGEVEILYRYDDQRYIAANDDFQHPYVLSFEHPDGPLYFKMRWL